MSQPVPDLIGRTFGSLTVLEPCTNPNNKSKNRHWLCQCICGNTAMFVTFALTSNRARSCGCKHRDGRRVCTPPGHSGFVKVLGTYKYAAKKRGLVFDLTDEQVRRLTKSECFYCGLPPTSIAHASTSGKSSEYCKANSAYIYNGMDRKDNTIGYIEGNVVACCAQCNMAKGTYTVEEFIDLAKRIVNKQRRNKAAKLRQDDCQA